MISFRFLKLNKKMLEFSANVKRKPGNQCKWSVIPFPTPQQPSQRYVGIFTGISVEVCAPKDINAIYECGFYGKGSKSRSVPESVRTMKAQKAAQAHHNSSSESLSLDLEESFFLAHFLNVLCINNLEGNEISWSELLQDFTKLKSHFMECLAAYLYMKSKNWVIKSGIKFGGDFVIYNKGPRFYHASFIVIISTTCKPAQMQPHDIKGLQRIAETSDKDILILEVSRPHPDFIPNSLEDFTKFTISETIIRRFNYTAYVQSRNSIK